MSGKFTVRIIHAAAAHEIEITRSLFGEYAGWLAIDLSFQNFDEEVSGLPGDYASPNGLLLLALVEREVAGCVGLRRWEGRACEMKRMWVRPQFRGHRIGRALAEAVIAEARKIDYSEMFLDSLSSLTSALSLYKALGFEEIAAYRHNPDPNVVFMRLPL
jgi:carbonic anhydrase